MAPNNIVSYSRCWHASQVRRLGHVRSRCMSWWVGNALEMRQIPGTATGHEQRLNGSLILSDQIMGSMTDCLSGLGSLKGFSLVMIRPNLTGRWFIPGCHLQSHESLLNWSGADLNDNNTDRVRVPRTFDVRTFRFMLILPTNSLLSLAMSSLPLQQGSTLHIIE